MNLCATSGQGNVPPGFGWEDLPGAGKSQRACQHALWLPWYLRGLFITPHHPKKHMYTPLNSNLPICPDGVASWGMFGSGAKLKPFSCASLIRDRSIKVPAFLNVLPYFSTVLFSGRVLEPLPAAHMWRQGPTLDEAHLTDYKCLRRHSFRTRVASQTSPQRSPVEAERLSLPWDCTEQFLSLSSNSTVIGWMPRFCPAPGRWDSAWWLEDQCKGWIPFWLTGNSDSRTHSGVISSVEAERASQPTLFCRDLCQRRIPRRW